MTDFRALCAELLAGADEYTGMNPYMRLDNAMKAARAALSQPEPQGPTDEELLVWASYYGIDYVDISRPSELDGERAPVRSDELCIFARTILTSFGRPAIEPVPVAERPWEREGWCDEEGKCWFYWPEWSNENGDVVVLEPPMWEFRKPEALEVYPFSLPHHALPVPQP